MQMNKNKKGMGLNDVYSIILILVISGMLLGAGLLALGKFRAAVTTTELNDNVTTNAINATAAALSPIASTWIPVWVAIAGVAVVLGLILGSFMLGKRR